MIAALALPKAEQTHAFDKIRKDGILKLNIQNMKNGHPLERERRQGSINDADVRMCNGCNGFFDKKNNLSPQKKM